MGQRFIRYLKIIVSILSSSSASVTIVMAGGDLRVVASVIAMVAIVIFGVWFLVEPITSRFVAWWRANKGIPELADFVEACAPYCVRRAGEEDILWISTTAKRIYSGIDVIPRAKLLEWHRANPNGF